MSKNKKTSDSEIVFWLSMMMKGGILLHLGKLSIPVEERAGEDSYTLMSVTSGVGSIPQLKIKVRKSRK